ncbi:MAG: hypothetical protein U1E86_28400 [Burkholderiaceae bacterium]
MLVEADRTVRDLLGIGVAELLRRLTRPGSTTRRRRRERLSALRAA